MKDKIPIPHLNKGDFIMTLQWRHNGCDGFSHHQPYDCLLNRLYTCRSKKTSKLCVAGLCAGNSPVTGEFPAQMASNAENVSIWWRLMNMGIPQHHIVMYIQNTISGVRINYWMSFLEFKIWSLIVLCCCFCTFINNTKFQVHILCIYIHKILYLVSK